MSRAPLARLHRREHLAIRHQRPRGEDEATPTDEVELTEERMRRALGLGGPTPPGAPSRPDPASPLRQRLSTLEGQLAEERTQHDQSRRRLEQAQRALAELQARAQRVALDQADELAGARRATMEAQRELDDLLFERGGQQAPPTPPDPPAPKPHPEPHPEPGPRLKPKPVRWWTASYRAKAKD